MAEANGKTVPPEVAEKQAGIDTSIAGLDELARANGGVFNPKTGHWDPPKDWVNQNFTQAGHPSTYFHGSRWATDNQKLADAQADNASSQIAHTLYGERVTPATIELTRERLVGGNPGELFTRINVMRGALQQHKEIYGGAVSQAQAANAASNVRREVSVDRDQPVPADQVVK